MILSEITFCMSHRAKRLLVFLLIGTAFSAAPAQAAENAIVITDDVLMRLGDSFREEGEYYRAITEYKELLILFPRSDKRDEALFKIGLSYYGGEEYASAARTFTSVREGFQTGNYLAPSRYYEGLSYLKLNKYGYADKTFDVLIEQHPAADFAARGRAAKSFVALLEERTADCREELERLARDYPKHPAAQKAKQALPLLAEYERLPEKSPVLAGVFSAVLPGSGYAYAGNYGDGVTAFVVNALFIAGAAAAANQKNYSTAYLVGAFGLPFYIGNIYGSANAAKKWNLGVRKEQRDKIYATLSIEY